MKPAPRNFMLKRLFINKLITKLLCGVLFVLGAVGATAQTTYYSKAAATDFNDVNSWGTATNGTGAAPSSISNADNFVVGNGSSMTLSAPASVRALYIGNFTGFSPASAAGTLTIAAGNAITVSRATGNNATLGIGASGTLTVSGGTLTLNGNMSIFITGKFNQSGGLVSVDGNNGGSTTNSVAAGTALVSFASSTSTDISLTGGTFTIVDPHTSSGTSDYSFVVNTTFTGSISATTGHTFKFGDGTSSDAGTTNGFLFYDFIGSGIFRFGNVILDANASNVATRFVFLGGNSSFSNLVAQGDLTINSGAELRQVGTTATSGVYVASNLTVNTGGVLTIPGILYFGTATGLTSTTVTQSATANAQTVSGAGTFRNLTASPTANFNSVTFNNTNSSGVTFSGANSMISGANTGTVSGTLTFTAGVINTGGNPFVLGTGIGAIGDYTWTAGGFGSGSMYGKWFASAVGGSAISAGTVPNTSANRGFYPFVNGVNSRQFFLQRPSTAGSTGGVIRVLYSEGAGGLTTITDVADAGPSYTLNRQSTASWTVSTSNGFAAGTGTFNYAVSGTGIYSPLTATARLMLSASVTGTHQAGTILPHAQRTAISAANFVNQFFIGVNNADVPVTSAQTGPWEAGSTWIGGVPPSSTQTALILNTHNVTVSASTGSTTVTGTQINSGGTLTITGGALTVGATNYNNVFTNSGTLTISGGALNINGNLNSATGSTFSQTGGTITVDGNDNNTAATSVATGTPIVHIQTSSVTMSGGSLIIVDPHVGTAAADDAFRYTSSSNASATTAHTLQIGNGSSTQAGGNATNGFSLHPQASTGLLLFGNIVIDANTNAGNRFVATRNTSTTGLTALGNLTITSGEARILSGPGNFTVAGNVVNNATLTTIGTLSLSSVSGTSLAASANAQTISGSGTFQNLASSPTANFASITVNNSNATGVTFSGSNWNSLASTVSSTLTITTGRINIGGANTLTLGTAAASAGTLSWVTGGFTQGTFKRWIGTSAITLGTNAGRFPFVSSANDNRNYEIGTSGVTTGNTYSVTYADGAGTTPVTSFTDNGATITKVSNATWAVSQAGILPASATLTMRIRGDAITTLVNVSGVRITGATGSVFTGATSGTGSGTTTNAEANKATTTVNDVTASPTTLYFGTGDVFQTAASGNWEDGPTWVGGISPGAGCADVLVNATHVVTVNASAASCKLLEIVATGGVTVSGSTLTVGCINNNSILNNNGSLTVSGGNLTVNGNLAINNGASFTHSSGIITIDGNDNSGTTGNASSVASGTPLFAIGTSVTAYSTGGISLTGGSIVIVDPHIGSANVSNAYAVYARTSVSINAATTHTFQFGDGTSTAAGSSGGGFVFNGFAGTGRLNFGNLTVNAATGTNRIVSQIIQTNAINGNLTVTQGTFTNTALTTNIGGNISVASGGNFITGNTTSGTIVFCFTSGTVTAAQTDPQSVSVSGTGTINSSSATPAANFVNVTFNNTSSTGVTFNALNNNSGAAGFTGASILNTITWTAGRVTTTGGNALLWGSRVTRGTGNFNYTAGGMTPGSIFAIGTTGAQTGTTITAGSAPTAFSTSSGGYPMLDATGQVRFVWIGRTTASGTGIIGVKYTDGTGLTNVSIPDASPAYTVNKQYNGYWTVSTFGTTPAATSFTMAISAVGAFGSTLTANYPRIITLAGTVATNQAGTTLPHGQRTGLTLAQLTAQDFYLGVNSADIPFVTAQPGSWETGSTWITGSAPTSSDNPIVLNGHIVTVNATPAAANTVTVNSGGTLIVSGSTLSVTGTMTNTGTFTASGGTTTVTAASTTGITNSATTGVFVVSGGTVNLGITDNTACNRTFTNNGTLTVSSGTLNIYGNYSGASGSSFNQSGGDINVDGNAGGVTANSVSGSTPLVLFNSELGTVNGGTMTIVDPNAASAAAEALRYSVVASSANWSGHTLKFGNGVSTDASANTNGFEFDTYYSSGELLLGHLTVDAGSGTNRWVSTSQYSTDGSDVGGNVTINAGSEIRNISAGTGLLVGGNITNNGTLTTNVAIYLGSLSATTFIPSPNPQTISGSGTFRNATSGSTASMAALQVYNSNSAGVTLNVPLSISSSLTLSQGALAINGNTLTVNGTISYAIGTIKGSPTSNLVIGGTALNQTLNFTPGSDSLNDLTLNAGSSATLGTSLDVFGTIALTTASLNLNAKKLTLKSTATNTARIADLTGSTLSGATDVTMERYIKLRAGGDGRAYRLLTPTVNTTGSMRLNWMENGLNTVIGANDNPVPGYGTQITGSGGNANGFDKTASNAASIYSTANAVTPTYTAIGNTTGTLNAKTGYFMYVRGDRSMDMQIPLGPNMPTSATTLRATGTVLTGTQTTFTNAYTGGGALNLVTNPYPSPIDWSLVQPAASGITGSYTYWDANIGTRGGFATVTTAGVSTPSTSATQIIQSGQAFFVESDGSVPTVTIQENHKVAGNNNDVFLVPPPPVESFRTELYFTEPNGYRRIADGAIALYDNSYNAAVDKKDAKEINNWDENIAISRDGKHLAIEARPVIGKSDDLPIFMNNMKKQGYEFEFTPLVFTNTNLKAELVDNFLGTRTLLSVVHPTVVSFTITDDPASKATDRFKVVFGQFGNPTGVDAITIKASQQNGGVQVNWSSKTETDMVRYEVEKSTYGTNFVKVNTTAAIGNSNTAVDYNWFDTNPYMGTSFYRIKGIDKAGNVRYSEMVKVLFGKGEPAIVVYPNPVQGRTFKIDMYNLVKGTYVLSLYSNEGRLVHSQQLQHDGSQATRTITLNGDIAQGAYQLQMSGAGGFKTTKQIIKN